MIDYLIGHIRTFVPVVVGGFITWLASLGVELPEEWDATASIATTGLVIGVYYAAVRALAQKWPWFGNLLGVNIAPEYKDTPRND